MTLTVAIDGLGVLNNAETTTNWNAVTIGAEAQEGDVYLQGSYSVSSKASSKAGELYYDVNTDFGRDLDFDTAGTEEGQLIFIWINVTTLGILESLANYGLGIRLYTNSSDWAEWTIAGYDDLRNFRNKKGGFVCFALDPSTDPTRTNGTWDLGAVELIGVHIDVTDSAKSENLMIDTIAVGRGIRVTGTHTNGWNDMVDYCTAYATRAWGMVQIDDSGSILLMGKVTIGDSGQTASTTLQDQSKKFKWIHTEYYDANGQWMPMVKDDFMGLFIEDANTYPTQFEDGVIVGTDSGRNGSIFEGADAVKCIVDLYGGNEADSYTKLYGTQFKKIKGGITWGNDSDHLFYGGIVDECGQFDPVGGPLLRNLVFSNTVDQYSSEAIIFAYDFDSPAYNDETTDINSATANDVALLPSTIAAGDLFYIGKDKQFSKVKMLIGTVGTSLSLDFEYYNGSTWATLTVTDDASDWLAVGTYNIEFDPPSDWVETTVNGQGPYFWIRVSDTDDSGGGALGTQAWVQGNNGSALLWNSNINIQKCSFIANTGANSHAIEHPDDGTFGYTDLIFSGNDYDIHFTDSAGNLIINATDSDPSTYENESSGTVTINVSADVDIEVVDSGDNAIVGARVFIEADSGGSYPSYEAVTQITASGTTATVSHTAHGMFDGQKVCIRGATNSQYYNGVFTITYIDVDSYSYTMDGSPPSPATGTITATFVLMNELTIAGGLATESVKVVGSQPIQGWVRYMNPPDYYKDGNISGDFDSDGFSAKITLVDDD